MTWTNDDIFLFNQGTNYCAYEHMGAHITPEGVNFCVWVPGARSVCVAGSFNGWRPDEYYMEPVESSGIWQTTIAAAHPGDTYKYVITADTGEVIYKADPYAFSAQKRPETASVIADIEGYTWHDDKWILKRKETDHFRRPLNIYEVHPGSWRGIHTRVPGSIAGSIPYEEITLNARDSEGCEGYAQEEDYFLTYRELADQLVPYVREMGYTHIELMPISEHPFDGSWGYQVTGYYAPTSRYGTPKDLMYLVDSCHRAGIGVIMDWVPGHFCRDAHGLAMFNGHMLYENKEHVHWGTFIFDYGRPEVRSFLLSNAHYWISRYHMDAIRVDGVSSMLYLNYGIDEPSRKQFNKNGGEENLEAISLLQEFNEMVGRQFAGVFTIAEESTAWPLVTYPPEKGGLGFHYKWDMGWMNDTLRYFSTDFIYRKYDHNLLTFSMMYAFSENFILPLSHDEVVHGKRSLIGRMPGTYEMQFQGLKCLAMYQICHTGAKLSFMGNEFAQFIEWRFSEPLEWFLLDYDRHRTHLEFIRELNQTYLKEAPLWKDNFGWDGFAWIDADNGEQSVVSFYRTDTETGKHIICILNLCPCDYPVYEIGVPDHGYYEEILNSDDVRFGGEGRVNADRMKTTPSEKHGCAQSLSFHLPPLSGLLLKCTRKLKRPEPKPEKSSAAKKDARTEKAKTEKQKRKN